MTNPGDIVRVRARNGGRASVYEANGWAQGFTAGLLDGNGVVQNTSANMNVLVGGSTTKPDVVLATNPSGYRIALDLVGQQAVAITAPASNSRITSIVAYTNDLAVASTQTTTTGSPATCGLIAVNGTSSASPVEPSDATIRSAITADGGTGSQACYCVIANIVVSSNTTAITNSLITINNAEVMINDGQIKARNLDKATVAFGNYSLSEKETDFTWVDGKKIYKKTFLFGSLPNSTTKTVQIDIVYDRIIKVDQDVDNGNGKGFVQIPSGNLEANGWNFYINQNGLNISTNTDRSSITAYFTLYYTK